MLWDHVYERYVVIIAGCAVKFMHDLPNQKIEE